MGYKPNISFLLCIIGILIYTDSKLQKEYVCKSINLRNRIQSKILRNCTVIEGFLSLQLMQSMSKEEFQALHFPRLREITDFLFISKVHHMTTLSNIFPNLAVIRGQNLFYNYALVLYSNPDLRRVGLKSLRRIVRGDVSFTKNIRLCYIGTVDWKRIIHTGELSGRKNMDIDECLNICPRYNDLQICPKVKDVNKWLCWTEDVCQEIKCSHECEYCYDAKKSVKVTWQPNDFRPYSKYKPDKRCCDPECLGGCDGPTNSECFACRSVLHQGRCVLQCPKGFYKYLDRRCISDSECRSMTPYSTPYGESTSSYKPFDGECSSACPRDYNEDEDDPTSCVPCKILPCPKVCDGSIISSIENIQAMKGCVIIKGDLIIDIPGAGGIMNELEKSMSEIREIRGILKVIRTALIYTLSFLSSLTIIHGDSVQLNKSNSNSAITIFDNTHLEHIFDLDTHPRLQVKKGGFFFHYNPRLCPAEITRFAKWINISEANRKIADVSSITNGDRVACFLQDIKIYIDKVTPTYINVKWTDVSNRDAREVVNWVLYYRETKFENLTIYTNREVCDDDIWKSVDVTADSSSQNSTIINRLAYQKLVTDLHPATMYAVFVRLFTIRSASRGARSNITYVTTSPREPTHVTNLKVVKNVNSFSVSWLPPDKPNGIIKFYWVTMIAIEPDPSSVARKDYCRSGVFEEMPAKQVKPSTTVIPKDFTNKYTEDPDKDCCKCGENKKKDKDTISYKTFDRTDTNIDFENTLQNRIYIKSTTVSKNFKDDEKINITAYIQNMNKGSRKSHKMPKQTRNRLEDTQFNKIDKHHFGTHKLVFNRTLPADQLQVHIPELHHFYDYQIHIIVCLTKNQLCSPPIDIYSRTLSSESADIIEFHNVSHTIYNDPGGESKQVLSITWAAPSDPNGFIVAYKIIIDDSNSHLFTICISNQKYIAEGYGYKKAFKDVGNYSYQIQAMSISGLGPFTKPIFFDIMEVDIGAESSLQIIVTASVTTIFFVALIILAIVYFVMKQNGYLDKYIGTYSMNPDYGYIADDWEVPRDSIKILTVLGQGSFGAVYHGLASGLSKMDKDETLRVAIKTVNDKATINDRIQFLKEASVMKAFSCVHVVKLLGVVSVGQPTLVIMELMPNGDLKKFLHLHRTDNEEYDGRSAPTVTQIIHWAGEIADGMAYLSRSKFVHRDLAARNCMVSEDLIVKIGDFGMTRDIYDLDYYRKDGRGLLPVRWMSPEALRDGKFDSQSDSWSFGVVLWEMVTLGELPYQGFSNDEVLRYVVDHGVMQIPIGCPQKLSDVMLRCWRFRPRQRPTFSEIIRLLEDCLSSEFKENSYYFNSSQTSIIISAAPSDDETEHVADETDGAYVMQDAPLTMTGDTGYQGSIGNTTPGSLGQQPHNWAGESAADEGVETTPPEAVPLMTVDQPPSYKPPPAQPLTAAMCRIKSLNVSSPQTD